VTGSSPPSPYTNTTLLITSRRVLRSAIIHTYSPLNVHGYNNATDPPTLTPRGLLLGMGERSYLVTWRRSLQTGLNRLMNRLGRGRSVKLTRMQLTIVKSRVNDAVNLVTHLANIYQASTNFCKVIGIILLSVVYSV